MDATAEQTKESPTAETAASAKDPTDAFGWLPCQITLQVPITGFSVGDLLHLAPGSIIGTSCHHTRDIPLRVNGLLIGWTEFEVIGDRLAARITELA